MANYNDAPAEREAQQAEAEHFTGGPGVAATKSQARGAVGGSVVAGIVGAVIGLIVGLVFFEGARGVLIAAVCFAVAGATFGGLTGGFVKTRSNAPGGQADV